MSSRGQKEETVTLLRKILKSISCTLLTSYKVVIAKGVSILCFHVILSFTAKINQKKTFAKIDIFSEIRVLLGL